MDLLHPSLVHVLDGRGYKTRTAIDQFLSPSLDLSPFSVTQMDKAVERIRHAIRQEEPIALYADRDVDGLSGLAILVRSLRTLGASVVWGSPLEGRGLERAVLKTLVESGATITILVDCGTGEEPEIRWLTEQGQDVIIADHHRVQAKLPEAFAWIHPGMTDAGHSESPCGSTMAFKLAEALWRSFIGPNDPERLQYFLFDHLDLVALGILADRVPLTGENRTLVWHGLRRLAKTRKEGLASLLRFFRLKGDTVTVRQATWQIIPLLNAAGRLGQPHWTTNLLITEDPWTARGCIDALLGLNTERRKAQGVSVDSFEKSVLEQCAVDKDPVLVATASGLEPSVTGLAAQALVQKYGRPAFLFVEQGDDFVGSGRGLPDVDLFSWIERCQDLLLKFGGHQGAVGMTVRKSDFPALREGLMKCAMDRVPGAARPAVQAEAELQLEEAGPAWWESLQRLEPFGQGFEIPAFELCGVDDITPRSKRSPTKVMLKRGQFSWPAEFAASAHRPTRLVATPQATPKDDFPFKWMIHEK
jgi:single-stranded-DNA-specific exonuclease